MPVAAMVAHAAHAETRAGTEIINVATLTARTGDGEQAIRSNPVTSIVAERLDVALARIDDARVTVTAGGVAVPLVLTNRGNGNEAFDVVALPSDATATVRGIAIDTNGDGRYDAATDTLLTGGRTPALDAGATLRLLVVVDPAGTDVTARTLDVAARAATGSGPQGTPFATRGDGGGDAITGATQAQAEVTVPFGAGDPASPVLIKSQSVRAPDGSANPVSGAIVTYRLEARFAGPALGVRIDDPIPQGTLYVPGSLTLDAGRISDAAGDDAGSADDAGIAMTLGDVTAPATHIVQFQVVIS